MRALSLTQPWATLIAIGAKRIETRSWSTNHRGEIAIHAAKGLGPVGGQRGLKEQCGMEPFCSILNAAIKQHHDRHWEGRGLANFVAHPFMPLGAIVATAILTTVSLTEKIMRVGIPANEEAFGDYTAGRYGWFFNSVKMLPQAIPCKGALGLWEVPLEIEQQIREATR